MFKKLALTAATFASLAVATPSQAVITTFASFNPSGSARNIRWERVGTADGKLYSTSSGSGTAVGNVNVNFTFLQNYFVSNGLVQNVTAVFSLSAITANDPATSGGGSWMQNIDSGSFSFTSTTAITVGSVTYAAGSNLLSGTFTNATMTGQNGGSAGGINDSGIGINGGPGSKVNFTSDFLDFNSVTTPTVQRDFALSLTSITPTPTVTANRSLPTFRASAGGNFASDPVPVINGVPEPAVWGMMIAGFGVVGFQSRRRRSIKTVTA